MTASLKDVAARAEVSPGTVSNYLNHPDKVAPTTAVRIAHAIRDLDFVANGAASVLRRGASTTIAHLTIELGNPFFAAVAAGIESRAEESGYTVLVANSGGSESREEKYLRVFEAQRVRGLLISSADPVEKRARRLIDRGFPVVLLDQTSSRSKFSSVIVDDEFGGQLATQHLLESGCRKIAFVGGPRRIATVEQRLAGAQKAVSGSSGTLEVVETDHRTLAVGRKVGAQIAQRPAADRPDAIFAVNDLLAVGVLHGLLLAGLRVPSDISVIGYDDIDFAADALIPLSTVRRPAEQFGRTAVDLLHSQIVAEAARGDRVTVAFEPALVVRQSTRK